METCKLSDFMDYLKPWLSDEYIRGAGLDENGRFVLLFTDGVKNVYQIDDCEKQQLIDVLNDLKEKGVEVMKPSC